MNGWIDVLYSISLTGINEASLRETARTIEIDINNHFNFSLEFKTQVAPLFPLSNPHISSGLGIIIYPVKNGKRIKLSTQELTDHKESIIELNKQLCNLYKIKFEEVMNFGKKMDGGKPVMGLIGNFLQVFYRVEDRLKSVKEDSELDVEAFGEKFYPLLKGMIESTEREVNGKLNFKEKYLSGKFSKIAKQGLSLDSKQELSEWVEKSKELYENG